MDLYNEIVQALKIKEGDRIWISSDVIGITMQWRKHGIKFDGNNLINSFQDAVGAKGTIMIPTFCYDFSNKGYYDYRNSKCCTGAIGNISLKREDFNRTLHPMHSFTVWGRDREKLLRMNNKHAFGDDSPLAYCLSANVKQVILNTDYASALTFVHYAETKCDVPYRFHKVFKGTYVDCDGNASAREYDYAARKLEWDPVEKINRIGDVLEKYGVAETVIHDGIPCHIVDLAEAFPIICKDINENKCKCLYDFSIDREQVFKGWKPSFTI